MAQRPHQRISRHRRRCTKERKTRKEKRGEEEEEVGDNKRKIKGNEGWNEGKGRNLFSSIGDEFARRRLVRYFD